jgi:hypothetical protein
MLLSFPIHIVELSLLILILIDQNWWEYIIREQKNKNVLLFNTPLMTYGIIRPDIIHK